MYKILCLILCLCLCACGQTGPLYLPDGEDAQPPSEVQPLEEIP